jgi:hypothetical protein
MHTAETARGRGIGRAMLDHLIRVARDRGFRRVSLETGTMAAFAPARSLYAKRGFVPGGRFGDYRESPNSTFMTLLLDVGAPSAHSLGAIERFADDVGMAGVLRRLGDDMQHHPASRPTCSRLEPRCLRQGMGRVQ